MKSFIILGVWLSIAASAAPVPTCATGTYASFEALPNGCVVNNLLFTNFADTESSTSPAVALTAGNITVTPDFFPLDGGLEFNSSWSVSGSGSLTSTLTYVVQTFDSSNTLSGINLSFTGSATGSGTSTEMETYCLGSALGTASCPTTNQVIAVSSGSSGPFTQFFTGTSSVLSVTNQISAAGNGGVGTASITVVNDNFSTAPVPEPMTFLLFGGGLMGIGLLRLRARS